MSRKTLLDVSLVVCALLIIVIAVASVNVSVPVLVLLFAAILWARGETK